MIPAALRDAGREVVAHSEVFVETSALDSVADEDWIRYAGGQRLVALTHDNNIRSSPDAVQATIDTAAIVFVVRGDLPHPALADIVVKALPKIEQFVADRRGPFIAFVRRRSAGAGKHVIDVGEYPKWRDQASRLVE